MKYVKIFILCMIFVSYNMDDANAQVHMNGVNHLEIHGGIYDSFENPGYHAGFYYSKVRNKHWWWRIGFQYNTQQINLQGFNIATEKYLANGSYFYTLGSMFKHRLYFNVGLGALAGYEQLNGGESRVNESIVLQDRSKPVFGLNPEANMELFITSKFIFMLRYNKRVLINSDLSVWDDVYGAGLKFYVH